MRGAAYTPANTVGTRPAHPWEQCREQSDMYCHDLRIHLPMWCRPWESEQCPKGFRPMIPYPDRFKVPKKITLHLGIWSTDSFSMAVHMAKLYFLDEQLIIHNCQRPHCQWEKGYPGETGEYGLPPALRVAVRLNNFSNYYYFWVKRERTTRDIIEDMWKDMPDKMTAMCQAWKNWTFIETPKGER